MHKVTSVKHFTWSEANPADSGANLSCSGQKSTRSGQMSEIGYFPLSRSNGAAWGT